MFLLTPLLAFGLIALFTFAWNRWFDPVPRRVIVLFTFIIAIYQAETLFTPKVDIPGDLAYHAYPWKALGYTPANANSGIVFTQMIPWTEEARRQLRDGELPLWNRHLGSGSPLLADLQTTIAHPFTLAGLFLPIGEAWTLSVVLRLFSCLFFLFLFLRRWGVHPSAAVFGAVAYTFSTFHVISLLFPLGLSMMILPMALVGVDEVLLRPSRRAFLLLTMALALAILGGHPESSLWVGLTAGAYALYAATVSIRGSLRFARLGMAALAALCSALLTAFFWYPAIRILPHTGRYASLTQANPLDHHIGADWMLPLLTPNILGTPMWQDYKPPQPQESSVPSDYGEVACGYAGILTLVLTLVAARSRRSPFWFFTGMMIFAFLTIYETPGWYSMIRSVPWVGMALHQRWRFLWALGAAGNASLALSALIEQPALLKRCGRATIVISGAVAAIYFFRWKEILERGAALHQLCWLVLTAFILAAFAWLVRRAVRGEIPPAQVAAGAALLTFLELTLVTFRYNPPTTPARLYPVSGAIAAMQQADRAPHRMAALGWSFLPDTPGYYGLEDVKTTDIIQYAGYARLLNGFLRINPNDFNSEIGDVSSRFFDFLGVRDLYVPPGVSFHPDASLSLIYQGRDGAVYRNAEAFSRYRLAGAMRVAPTLDAAIAVMKSGDLADLAAVDHIPQKIARMSGGTLSGEQPLAGGKLTLFSYEANESVMRIESRGWNLLVSSDVWMPGWRVYWNGARLPPVIVNGAFVGSFVPPGAGELKLRYMPDEFVNGLRVSGLTFLLMLAGLAAASLRHRPDGRVAEGNVSSRA